MGTMQNIDPSTFRAFLEYKGLNHIRDKGGHEIWSRKDMLRPVIFQSHISPVPEFIIRNNLRNMGVTKKELMEFLTGK